MAKKIKRPGWLLFGIILIVLPIILNQTQSSLNSSDQNGQVIFRLCDIGDFGSGYACKNDATCSPKPTIAAKVPISGGGGNSVLLTYRYNRNFVLITLASDQPQIGQLLGYKTYNGKNIYYNQNTNQVYIEFDPSSFSEFNSAPGICSSNLNPNPALYDSREVMQGLSSSTTTLPSGGGGGTSTTTLPSGGGANCQENWQCGSWSSCSSNTQTRTCTDANYCGTTNNEPPVTQSCSSGGGNGGGDFFSQVLFTIDGFQVTGLYLMIGGVIIVLFALIL